MTLERTGMRGTAGAVAIRWREGAVEFHYFLSYHQATSKYSMPIDILGYSLKFLEL